MLSWHVADCGLRIEKADRIALVSGWIWEQTAGGSGYVISEEVRRHDGSGRDESERNETSKKDDVEDDGEFDPRACKRRVDPLTSSPSFQFVVREVGRTRLQDDVFVAAHRRVHGVPPRFSRGVQDGSLTHERACLTIQNKPLKKHRVGLGTLVKPCRIGRHGTFKVERRWDASR